MEAHIQKLAEVLERWRKEVTEDAGEGAAETNALADGVITSAAQQRARDLATLTVVTVIKETIHARARKSQATAVATRLHAQAEIVHGYPKAMYHLCTADV